MMTKSICWGVMVALILLIVPMSGCADCQSVCRKDDDASNVVGGSECGGFITPFTEEGECNCDCPQGFTRIRCSCEVGGPF